MPTIMKVWLKTILLPHLCSLLLLELFVLPHAVPLLWSGKAALPEALSALFSPLLLWLLGGTLAWRGVFAFPNIPLEYTVAVLLIIAAALLAGCLKRHTATGRRLVSFALWLWFAYGLLVLGVQG
ncbi:hypothetical protein H9Q10_09425 [Eikenella sp. S3360]|uniref:Uncharacterized protein n=1 Tax=Eikenella glucosivorans TaxID=2766967 RepID=A0ABS0NC78_9NEIS|nr:hypothetical protein [Eikenella glucosivorans]MBH5329884.1 hypothetical protein [Eikenella glucosivorans]